MTRTQVADAFALTRQMLADPHAPMEIADLADLELRVRERIRMEQAALARQFQGIEAAQGRYLP